MRLPKRAPAPGCPQRSHRVQQPPLRPASMAAMLAHPVNGFKTRMVGLTTPSNEGTPRCGAGFPGSAGVPPAWTMAGLRPAAGRMPALPGGRPQAYLHGNSPAASALVDSRFRRDDGTDLGGVIPAEAGIHRRARGRTSLRDSGGWIPDRGRLSQQILATITHRFTATGADRQEVADGRPGSSRADRPRAGPCFPRRIGSESETDGPAAGNATPPEAIGRANAGALAAPTSIVTS